MTLETQTAHKQRGNGARSFFPIAVAVYDSPMPSLLIENAEDDRFLNNICYAATALCCYDYCLTLGREVELVWSGKLSLASVLFYALRYSALLDTVLVMLGYLSWPAWQTTRSCVIIIRVQMAGDVFILSSAAVFAAMRMYALCHRKWMLCISTLVLGLLNPMISMYTFIISPPILWHAPTYQTCTIDNPDVSNLWMLGARVASIAFDGFVLVLTWRGTRRSGLSHRLKEVLMSDTALYFGFLFILNSAGICLAIAQLEFIDAISTLTAILTSIFMSRLMLNLRSVHANDSQTADTLLLSTVDALDSTPPIGWDEAMELPRVMEGGSRA